MALPARDKIKIAVVGLGYVGLPLAVYLSRHFPVVGFDVDPSRIEQLRKGVDRTQELTAEELTASSRHHLQRRHQGARRLQFLHRHRADADRPGQAARICRR